MHSCAVRNRSFRKVLQLHCCSCILRCSANIETSTKALSKRTSGKHFDQISFSACSTAFICSENVSEHLSSFLQNNLRNVGHAARRASQILLAYFKLQEGMSKDLSVRIFHAARPAVCVRKLSYQISNFSDHIFARSRMQRGV
jgi:hypothetical protein